MKTIKKFAEDHSVLYHMAFKWNLESIHCMDKLKDIFVKENHAHR